MLDRTGLVVCGLIMLLGCSKKVSEKDAMVLAAPVFQTAEPAPTSIPEMWSESETIPPDVADLSVAVFLADHQLTDCADIRMTFVEKGPGLSAEAAAAMMAEYVLGWILLNESIGRRSSEISELLSAYAGLTKLTLEELIGRLTVGKHGKPFHDLENGIDQSKRMYNASWPPIGFEEQAKAGDIVRLKSCDSTQKIKLGTCAVVHDGLDYRFEVAWHRYSLNSTSDSDKAMKDCLVAGGEWTAPSKDDSHHPSMHASSLCGMVPCGSEASPSSNDVRTTGKAESQRSR